jgi:cyclopropane-fatty-acyl-phospholipid synthase
VALALRRIVESLGRTTETPFRVCYADGHEYCNREGPPAVTFRFRTAGAERQTFALGHVGLLEAYFESELDIEGDFAAAFRVGFESGFEHSSSPLVTARNRWHEATRSNRSLAQAKANARFHYGLGTAFYRQWLDSPLMMYTCGYWPEGTTTLEQAQAAKIDHVARKLRLAPGESVVDIGCGFGGFMFRAQERYGVRATGVNTTTEQVEWVAGEIARRRLGDQLAVREADFREVHARFDKVVSIGVLEHAGRDQLEEVVRAHAEFLEPGGLGMLHFIGHVGVTDTEFYIREYVFPGGWIPSLAQTLEAMEACGLEVLDVENLRRHYAPTLDVWAERFDRNWPAIQALDPARFDERFRRIWRTYLHSCAEMFRAPRGRTHLFQIVFSKGNVDRGSYPMSRDFLYRGSAAGPDGA